MLLSIKMTFFRIGVIILAVSIVTCANRTVNDRQRRKGNVSEDNRRGTQGTHR